MESTRIGRVEIPIIMRNLKWVKELGKEPGDRGEDTKIVVVFERVGTALLRVDLDRRWRRGCSVLHTP